MAAKKIVMLTDNDRKAFEYRAVLGRYAVRPIIINHAGIPDLGRFALGILRDGVAAVVAESSDIYPPGQQAPFLRA